MSELNIGKIITTEQHRDAVHFPIVPVSSNETLFPGTHVGLVDGSTDTVSTMAPPIGIVDPFLKGRINPGQKFWLFLYQNTVTGMRHHWQHPAFADAPTVPLSNIAASKKWLEDLAPSFDMDYADLMSAARAYIDHGEYVTEYGSDSWRDEFYAHEDEFWKHYEIVTGTKVDDKGSFFSCSC